MDNDLLFLITDPSARYTCGQIVAILERAEKQGHPLERGSYLESMTIAQVDRLTRKEYDA